jgi:hypothetical protein
MKISLRSFQWSLDPLDRSKIHTSESQLPFATEYTIQSPRPGLKKHLSSPALQNLSLAQHTMGLKTRPSNWFKSNPK